jgi:hypothetical protein
MAWRMASSFAISMKPKPRLRPVSRSVTTWASTTSPQPPNICANCALVHCIGEISYIDPRSHFWPLFLTGTNTCPGSQASHHWRQHSLRIRTSLDRLVEIGGFRRASMLPKATRGKGERDQRGFQYTTVHRMVGRLSMPIARRARQMETGGAPPEVGSASVIDTTRGRSVYLTEGLRKTAS